MALQKNELLTKLGKIRNLYEETVSIRSEMDTFVPEDCYEREIEVPEFPGEYESERIRALWRDKLDHTYEGAVAIAEKTHREVFSPKAPDKLKLPAFEKPKNRELLDKQAKYRSRSFVGAGVGIFFFLGIFSCLQSGYGAPFVITVALIGAAIFLFFRKKYDEAKKQEEKETAEALLAHNQHLEELKAAHAEKMKAYEDECAKYEANLQKFLEDYATWRAIYLQSVSEEAQIAEKLEADRIAAVKKIYEERYVPAEAALQETNDLVTEKYLPVLDVIIDLLRSGRADDLKEAVNLFEDLVYRERQLALEREKEEQRQQEERMRRQAEERHHKEQMRFQQDQERQRQREEQQRQQDAERRHREEMAQRDRQERDRQYEERRRAEEDRRSADRAEQDRRREEERNTRDQCNRCAEVGHCSMSFRRPNCASFRPR